jgi:phenylalanyl-tRNA synthetase beta chain
MKFSENWLREWVNPAADREELVRRMTMAGLEVEAVSPLGEQIEGVVISEIVGAERHPNADKLQVCRVRCGAVEPLQIVCGAPNARVGLKAPLAVVGAKMPNGMTIKRAALRGVESHGMLCSAAELGLGEGRDGLLELPADAPIGAPLAQYLDLPDAGIELKLTPNRPDCLGLRGLASEVATLFGMSQVARAFESASVSGQTRRAVQLSAPQDCPRYLGRVIENIDARAPTPLWMVERLRRSGVRSISAVVDCTNYVMLELGQPMHAFDHDTLDGAIDVRRASAGEVLKLLDGREVVLDAGYLVIADARRAVALAGVMGGYDTRVHDGTRNVFLESAHFAPAAIMGRARKLGMHTDASHRFERGVDPELPRLALERLTELLVRIAGGTVGPIEEAVAPSYLPRRAAVDLRAARLRRVLGLDISAERVEVILTGLDMQVERTPAGWRVTPPSRRFDIEIEEDLIEEVVRVYGYDAVPVRSPQGEIVAPTVTETQVALASVCDVLRSRGYHEAVNFAFTDPALLATWGIDARSVRLSNPLSGDMGVMRSALLPGLVASLARNLARQQQRVRLFEVGKVFVGGAIGESPTETERLALVAEGAAHAEQWGQARRPLDFFDIKGDLAQILALRGVDAEPIAFAAQADPRFHPGRSAQLRLGGEAVGWVGALHPRLLKALGLDQDVYALEMDLRAVLVRRLPVAGEPSRYPSVRRDLAVVLPLAVPYAALEACVRAAAGTALRQVVLFDQYLGAGLKADSRSLAIGLILQDDSRTLVEEEVDQCVARVVQALQRDHGAQLRS